MKNRFLFVCLAFLALSFGGCDKLRKILHLKTAETTVVVAPTPAPAPVAPPAPTPPPAPAPVAINRAAAAIVLCYHRFEDKPHDDLAIAPAEFEQQMQTLKDKGFSVIPMQDLIAWRHGDKDIPAKSCVITIDDGYRSGYDVAWPILKKYSYPFTMFVYIQYIGSGGSQCLTWDQLGEMRDAGVDIESHTYSHQNLHGKGSGINATSLAEIRQIGYEPWLHKEIVDSKQALEKQLGIRANAFAYPYGVYNQKARDMVKEAGYDAAFTVYGQRIGFTTPVYDLLGRYAIGSKHPEIFQSAIDMIGGGQSGPPPEASLVAQVAATSMATEPMQGETISNPKPAIKANLATMGDVEPNSVVMRISGFGAVPAKYDDKTKLLSFQVTTQPLRDKSYSVFITAKVGGKKVETTWSFNFDPSAPASATADPATSLPPSAAKPPAAAPAK